MGRTVWHIMMSLDGFIAGPGAGRIDLQRTSTSESGQIVELRIEVVSPSSG